MLISDVVGLGIFSAFGEWWVFAPRSVIRFYVWFHSGRMVMPKPFVVRIVGLVWLAMLALVFFYVLRNPRA